MKYTLQQNCWNKFTPEIIDLPDNWKVSYHGIKGDQLPALTAEQISEKINDPYGMAPLTELARNSREVVIVFDDISRATPTKIMAEVVLKELHKAGVKKDQIRFICALGMHGAHSRTDFVHKLGKEIVKEYAVYNHNPYENCVTVGTTQRGVKVEINAEFMNCDLRIGLGAITPHPFNGYGGGGKILFPGLAAADTIQQNHSTAVNHIVANKLNLVNQMGKLENDAMRKEVEEMTLMVCPFFKVDAIYNTKLEIVDLYAGHPVEEYYAAAPAAIELYATPRASDNQVVIVNANAKGSEAAIAMHMATLAVAQSGGDVVIVNSVPGGQVTHYLLGGFGKTVGGRMWGKIPRKRPNIRKVIYYSRFPDLTSSKWFGEPEKLVFASTWDEVMEHLSDRGEGTKAAVIADGTISYFSD